MPDSASTFPRPRPTIGDATSAAERAKDPQGWAFPEEAIGNLDEVIRSRRDIRRFRPDPVPPELIEKIIEAGHMGPSVGHSQPWRFIIISDAETRERAAAIADAQRITQASAMTPERGQQLLDLKLEGLREAPLGIVVACDRRAPALGVLGRATFTDADMWSCACAVENMWLSARSLGLGMGWVTLFPPEELGELLGLPEGVETLGWLCVGWPNERPPEPGLQRLAWSKRLPLSDVVMHESWPADDTDVPGLTHYLRAPEQHEVVGATDVSDQLLSPPGSLGVLDRELDAIYAVGGAAIESGTLVLVGADHRVSELGISAYPTRVTSDVMVASVAGTSLGVVSAAGAGLASIVVDAGVATAITGARNCRVELSDRGNIVDAAAMARADVDRLIAHGQEYGREAAANGLVALGEVGVGNTTVAAALVCALLQADPAEVAGQGAGADHDMVERKIAVITQAGARSGALTDPVTVLAELGGPEFAVLTGVILGAAEAGAPIVLDGLATSVCALIAQRLQPGVHAYLHAGQRSRERGHQLVLQELGLEPLLALRLRAGEGVGAAMASSLLLQGLRLRRLAARTS